MTRSRSCAGVCRCRPGRRRGSRPGASRGRGAMSRASRWSAAASPGSRPRLSCADAGAEVTLVEVRPRLGGAAYSFERDGMVLDNGQHVFLRCCTAYRALLDRLGTALRHHAAAAPGDPGHRTGRPGGVAAALLAAGAAASGGRRWRATGISARRRARARRPRRARALAPRPRGRRARRADLRRLARRPRSVAERGRRAVGPDRAADPQPRRGARRRWRWRPSSSRRGC